MLIINVMRAQQELQVLMYKCFCCAGGNIYYIQQVNCQFTLNYTYTKLERSYSISVASIAFSNDLVMLKGHNYW